MNPNFELLRETQLHSSSNNEKGVLRTAKNESINYEYFINAAGQQSLGIA